MSQERILHMYAQERLGSRGGRGEVEHLFREHVEGASQGRQFARHGDDLVIDCRPLKVTRGRVEPQHEVLESDVCCGRYLDLPELWVNRHDNAHLLDRDLEAGPSEALRGGLQAQHGRQAHTDSRHVHSLPQAEEARAGGEAAARKERMKQRTPRVDGAELLKRTLDFDVFA